MDLCIGALGRGQSLFGNFAKQVEKVCKALPKPLV